MFSSSVSRVARSSHAATIPNSIPGFCCASLVAASSRNLSCRTHQRRNSSSKPSSSANGPRGITQQPDASTAGTRTRPEAEKRSTRLSKRKAKDVAIMTAAKGRDRSILNIPSVPTTNHVNPAGKDLLFFQLPN